MSNETLGETLNGWQDLGTALAANAADLPHLETHRLQLADLLKQAQDLTGQQAALTASKQEASKNLEGVINTGRKVATFLRVGVKQYYGNGAEKLVEFKLRPLRSRSHPADTKPPAPVEPKPAAPVPPAPLASNSVH
jgi:hypothetical protein